LQIETFRLVDFLKLCGVFATHNSAFSL